MPLFCLATGLGGVEDHAFNSMQSHGLKLAALKHGISYTIETPNRADEDKLLLENFVRQGCGVIIAGGGFHMRGPVDELARAHPDVRFVLLDDTALSYPDNVSSVTFRQNEGSYLAGALAALMSRTGVIGFVGAVDIPLINDFLAGYKAGSRKVRPETVVLVRYLGTNSSHFNPFNAPLAARRTALDISSRGADVIFAVAAGSNKGVFVAVEEQNRFAIGVDADQDHLAPGYILTSMMKRLDEAVLLVVDMVLSGSLENRNYSLGLLENGVTLSPMTHTRAIIPPEVLQTIADLRSAVQNKTLIPPTALEPNH